MILCSMMTGRHVCAGAVFIVLFFFFSHHAIPPVRAVSGTLISGSFVGRVDGGGAFVVIVTDGANVRAYVCDGTGGGQFAISEWFKGAVSSERVDLLSQSGAGRITAKLEPTAAQGSFVIGGRTLAFTAKRDDGSAGFYHFKDTFDGRLHMAGWIVLPGGEQRGSVLIDGRVSSHSSLNVSSETAVIPGAGIVKVGKLTAGNLTQGFGGGCFPCGRLH